MAAAEVVEADILKLQILLSHQEQRSPTTSGKAAARPLPERPEETHISMDQIVQELLFAQKEEQAEVIQMAVREAPLLLESAQRNIREVMEGERMVRERQQEVAEVERRVLMGAEFQGTWRRGASAQTADMLMQIMVA